MTSTPDPDFNEFVNKLILIAALSIGALLYITFYAYSS